jgi:hypothetical protein
LFSYNKYGRDVDTICAITGHLSALLFGKLSGILFGKLAINKKWYSKLENIRR